MINGHQINPKLNGQTVAALMSNFPTLITTKVSQGQVGGLIVLPEAKFEIQFLTCLNLHHPDILSKDLMLQS